MTTPNENMPPLPEPAGWLITYSMDGEKRRTLCGHNSRGDYCQFDPGATSEPVYTHAYAQAYAAQRCAELGKRVAELTESLERIAYAGMSASMAANGGDATTQFHARQAWDFISIASAASTTKGTTMTDTTERDALTVNFMQHGGLDKQQARLIADIALQTRAALASSTLPASATPPPVAGDVLRTLRDVELALFCLTEYQSSGETPTIHEFGQARRALSAVRAVLAPSKQEGGMTNPNEVTDTDAAIKRLYELIANRLVTHEWEAIKRELALMESRSATSDAADAKRYQWLKTNQAYVAVHPYHKELPHAQKTGWTIRLVNGNDQDFDEAIDAVIAAGGSQNG